MIDVDFSNNRALSILSLLIRELGEELHWPTSRAKIISFETSLDRDLGLDSLSRVELISRVERAFGVVLTEAVFLNLNTIAELVKAIREAPQIKSHATGSMLGSMASPDIMFEEIKIPSNARTMVDVLKAHATDNPERIHLTLLRSRDERVNISFKTMHAAARRVASNLAKKGIKKGDAVALMLPTSEEYFFCFMGIMYLGAVPVALYPPSRPAQLVDHLERHAEILKNADAVTLITDRQSLGRLGQLLKLGAGMVSVVDANHDLLANHNHLDDISLTENDLAFIQYTSGSTGSPKGVMLSHRNILANIRAMGAALEATCHDTFVSWLPLYHDMGLIGAWLGSLHFGCHLVVMSPYSFLKNPIFWLETIDCYRATLTAAPNFAFELCLRHVDKNHLPRLDLSCLRAVCNGAEPVDARTVERFCSTFKNSKFNAKAFMPVYGLAENAVGLAFPELGRGPKIENISRNKLSKSGKAVLIDRDVENSVRVVSCGKPLIGHEIRIVDEANNEVAERREGRIQFKGPSSTLGYINRPKESKKLFSEGWVETGDLGYMSAGELYVTGRIKDLIKHAGRNIHPEELEMMIGRIPGIRNGCVAVFGSQDPEIGTERLIVLAETRTLDQSELSELQKSVNEHIFNCLGTAPDVVKLLKPHSLLKTSSGKLRRSACKELYESGSLNLTSPDLRLGLFRYALVSVWSNFFQKMLAYSDALRSVILWFIIIVISLTAWPFMVVLPTLNLRWMIARSVAKVALYIVGIRLKVIGNQISTHCIYVANHASYADVVFLIASLPHPVAFIAKSELKKNIPMKFTLDRLGVVYVERFDVTEALHDAILTTEVAKRGEDLLSFPEGTFTRSPGLLPFRMGPFLTAVDLGLLVSPIAINGARSILRPGSWIIRPEQVTVHLLNGIGPVSGTSITKDDRWKQALNLRDMARTSILKYCGEPSLG